MQSGGWHTCWAPHAHQVWAASAHTHAPALLWQCAGRPPPQGSSHQSTGQWGSHLAHTSLPSQHTICQLERTCQSQAGRDCSSDMQQQSSSNKALRTVVSHGAADNRKGATCCNHFRLGLGISRQHQPRAITQREAVGYVQCLEVLGLARGGSHCCFLGPKQGIDGR